jgi:hypothetical protein
MTVLITLTTAGADSGPFDLYSDLDGFTAAFETGVAKVDLLAGYPSALVPDGTTIIRVKSNNSLCTNYIDIFVTSTACNTYTFLGGGDGGGQFTYVECGGAIIEIKLNTGDSVEVCAENSPAPYVSLGLGTITLGPECTTTTTTTVI